MIIKTASAKINLTLNVLGKLPGGYHELQTVFILVPQLNDTLTFRESDADSISISGGTEDIALADNLVYKMADAVRKKYGVSRGFNCTIEKRIPVGAGLGGGSSDAAAALRGVEELWGLDIPIDIKDQFCAGLGSDLNFFLHADSTKPIAVGTGRGEKIEPLTLNISWLHIVIMQPPFEISTRKVFSHLAAAHYTERATAENNVASILRALNEKDFGLLLNSLNNDLTKPASLAEPRLHEYLNAIARLIETNKINTRVMLSGSGSCLFALFDNENEKELFTRLLSQSGISLKKTY